MYTVRIAGERSESREFVSHCLACWTPLEPRLARQVEQPRRARAPSWTICAPSCAVRAPSSALRAPSWAPRQLFDLQGRVQQPSQRPPGPSKSSSRAGGSLIFMILQFRLSTRTFGLTWSVLGASWTQLGASWAPLGLHLERLGSTWALLWPT